VSEKGITIFNREESVSASCEKREVCKMTGKMLFSALLAVIFAFGLVGYSLAGEREEEKEFEGFEEEFEEEFFGEFFFEEFFEPEDFFFNPFFFKARPFFFDD
jgi:hypothetical protein